jgi:hypothetical protein
MRFSSARNRALAKRLIVPAILFAASGMAGASAAAPYVEFDFARSAACRDVTPPACGGPNMQGRLIELTLPMSVRFHGLSMADVEEIDIEINGAASGMRVYDFSPSTQLTSDIAQPIETITTTKKARSLDATLGGQLPIPFGESVAHLSPSINGALSGGETATEKLNRLPPKHAVVVSGTSSEGRGVFFKLKRSSQTSLEGVHPLMVTFVAPADWQRDEVRVGCSARGRRKVLWLKQSATLGRAAGSVTLYPAGALPAHFVAKPVVADAETNLRPASFLAAAAAGVVDLVDGPNPDAADEELPRQHAEEDSSNGSAWRPTKARSSVSAQ